MSLKGGGSCNSGGGHVGCVWVCLPLLGEGGRVMWGTIPSSVRMVSCSAVLGALGRAGGEAEDCMGDGSSVSLRLASMSCSLERFGPVRVTGRGLLFCCSNSRENQISKH